MDKLSMQSVDGVAANIDIIARFFPSCITEARDHDGQLVHGIDFEKLKAELSSACIPEKAERYQFTWPGKMDAARLANQPSAATLRPCRDQSVDFDKTSNLYIEGDNLEVLKVLRNTYARQVKMIYIDPPYNTGHDFIYEDDFAMDTDEYLLRSGQRDESGTRLTVNPESNGRYHSDWLNMIYPRLKLARELLTDDGVIFISIDDYEVDNMRKVGNEIFGDRNFIAQLIWQRAYSPKNDARFVSVSHDYVLMFVKDINTFKIGRLPRTEKANSAYKNPDNDPRGVWQSDNLSVKSYTASCDYTITTPAGRKVNPPAGSCWRFTRERYEELVKDNRIWFGADGGNTPRFKRFLSELKNEGMVPESLLLYEDVGHSQTGARELSALLDSRVFDGPKPTGLLCRLITLANLKDDSIVLDFFSGSGSTAHALMKHNVSNGTSCRFIMVQLPEAVDENSPAGQEGYRTICEIGKERIRRAGAAVKEESAAAAAAAAAAAEAAGDTDSPAAAPTPRTTELDTGFRVLRLDSSNMMDVYYDPEQLSLGGFSEFNVKADRSTEDLLFQVMLELGIDLSSSITVRNIAGHQVYLVDGRYLAACFDESISLEAGRAIARLTPHYFVMCDAAFSSDADADNIRQIFAACSTSTQIRII